jgi:hypothetical protein
MSNGAGGKTLALRRPVRITLFIVIAFGSTRKARKNKKDFEDRKLVGTILFVSPHSHFKPGAVRERRQVVTVGRLEKLGGEGNEDNREAVIQTRQQHVVRRHARFVRLKKISQKFFRIWPSQTTSPRRGREDGEVQNLFLFFIFFALTARR